MEIKSYPFAGTGAEILRLLKDQPLPFLLESSLTDRRQGRYSFVGFDPFDTFQSRGADRLEELRRKYARYAPPSPRSGGPTPFPGGIFGYLSYDFGLHFEQIRRLKKEGPAVPECFFGFYDCVITLDHFARKLYIVSSGLPETEAVKQKKRARERLELVQKILEPYLSLRAAERRSNPESRDCFAPLNGARSSSPWKYQMKLESSLLGRNDIFIVSNFTKAEYFRAVRRALDYIKRGDIYQVNLSQRFSLKTPSAPDPYEVYRQLRNLSPTHFGGYFDCGHFQIVSSSPERFLSLRGREVETRPMKGTRPRGRTPDSDQANRKELWRSAKDQAELLMITDLERNDLGRVCDYGSVRVKHMRTLEEYNTVFQATSTITGRLGKDKDQFDLLRACFPGGSITGCPKIRAMDIIEELEPVRRGIYTGSMGYVSFSGEMDFNILIRTLLLNSGRKPGISFHAGGGIVADSVPQKEYAETLVKAKAMRDCLKAVLGHKQVSGEGAVLFLDGKFVPAEKSLLTSLTPGIIKGAGVFETVRAQDGQLLLFDRHLRRLRSGLKKINLRLPGDFAAALSPGRGPLQEALAVAGWKSARVRLMVWQQGRRTRTAFLALPYQPPSGAVYRNGFRAVVSNLRCDGQSPLANVKAIRYQPFFAVFQQARAKGMDEAIVLNRKGEMTEGSRSNIFLVKDGTLLTPPLSCGCLPGITRRAVIDLARASGLRVRETSLRPADLAGVQESFLTNSLWDIMPLTAVNGQRVGRGRPGRLTRELMKKYKQHLLSNGFPL